MRRLKTFTPEELLFNEQETREILIFFFPSYTNGINNTNINNDIRGFAQGLLVEAVEVSYIMGYAIDLGKNGINPTAKVSTMLRKFALKAAKRWFEHKQHEHATAKELQEMKIYKPVYQTLQRNFRLIIELIINGMEFKHLVSAMPSPELTLYV